MDPIFNFQTFTPSAAPTRISCFSGQTNKFALVFQDQNVVNVYQLNTSKPLYSFTDLNSSPRSLCFSKDDTNLVIGLDSGSVRIYNMQSGKILRAFTAHRTAVTALAITNNN